MTRGTLFYYVNEDEVYSSCEYNGDMYVENGVGGFVVKNMHGLKKLDDFVGLLKKVNGFYKYEYGGNAFSVSKDAILQANSGKRVPEFTDITTWKYWGCPNLSDYTYLYNAGKEPLMMTCEDEHIDGNKMTVTIMPGQVGVFYFRTPYEIAEDGKAVTGYTHGEAVRSDRKEEA